VPYYVLVEVLAPVFQVISVVVAPLAWWLGLIAGPDFVLLLTAMAFLNGVFTNIAVGLYDRGTRAYPLGDLVRLMLLGPLDLFLYRPILFFAQAKGLFDFLRGDKSWHKFARNRRAATV